jgi:hypothetical protein
MSKAYAGISALIFGLVAVIHFIRLVQGWHVQVGLTDVPMSVSWIGLVVSGALAIWGGILLRR